MKVLSVVILAGFLFVSRINVAHAQAKITEVVQPISALKFLVGKWQGKVKYEPGFGQPQEVFWSANVYPNAGGNILVIDEKGSELRNKNSTTKEVFVVVYWDTVPKEYNARIYASSKGATGSRELKGYAQNSMFVLQTKEGRPIRRYTVKVSKKTQWHEVGEVSDDNGESWKRTFEMTLTKRD